MALVQKIRSWFDGPLLLSGSIAHGRTVLAAQVAGADLAYIGSAFIATEEANADARYKQMIVDSTVSDIVYSDLFTGVHGNYLRGSIAAAGMDPENLPGSDPSKMNFGMGEAEAGNGDPKALRDIWGSGQGVGVVDEVVCVADLVDRLDQEYVLTKQELTR